MAREEITSGHRVRSRLKVFVIGAGMSASCGIPVSKDLLKAALKHLSTTNDKDAKEVHDLLEYLYPSFDSELRNYPNIEDFLNLLEMARRFNSEDYITSTLWSTPRLGSVRRIVLKAVTDYLWSQMQNKEKFQLIREFADAAFTKRCVIITFNWDVIVEHALHLHSQEPNFDYEFDAEDKKTDMFLLKPHGSIDLFKRGQLPPDTRDKDTIKLDSSLCVFPFFDFKRNPRLSSRLPVIVPPVSAKDFSVPFLKKTWSSVYQSVRRATDLIVIGYSLPNEDQFSRLVLRRAIRNNLLRSERKEKLPLRVTVVNPDPTVIVTFSRLVGATGAGLADIKFEQSHFEDYAEKYIKATEA